MASHPLFELRAITAGYGTIRVVKDISIAVPSGSVTALIGHNGSGKSTLLKAAFGISHIFSGEVLFDGRAITDLTASAWLRRGVAFVPQGNRVFNDLTVLENIQVAGVPPKARHEWQSAFQSVMDLFPSLVPLQHHRAETLSGGEKQLVSLAIAMVTKPRLLFLDEPSLGLSVSNLSKLFSAIRDVVKRRGTSVIIAEQKVREALRLSNFTMILRQGECAFYGPSDTLTDERVLESLYLS